MGRFIIAFTFGYTFSFFYGFDFVDAIVFALIVTVAYYRFKYIEEQGTENTIEIEKYM